MPFITTSVGGDGSGLPGPQGDPGNNGLDGAGFNPQPLVKSNLDPTVGSSMTLVGPDNPFLGAWSVGSYVRVINSVNTQEFFEGTITQFTPGGVTVTILISYVTATWTREGNTDVWTMTLAGERGSGSAADTADFVFTNVDASNSSMTITGDKEMTIESGADSDLNVRAGDQVWITAGNDVILQADDTVQVRSLDGVEILSNYVDMGDAEHRWQFTQGAELILPAGGIIFNAPESSSDGGLLSTLSIIPDATNETNQYVVLDPTGPNHIHIRAGGPIDESTAELILGGERTKVTVSDLYKSVNITTAATITNIYLNAHEIDNEDLIVPETSDILIGDNIVIAGINHPVTYFSQDPNNTGFSIVRATGVTFIAGESYTFVREEPYENYWSFGSDGVFSGPAMGGIKVPAIANTRPDDDLYIFVNGANADLRVLADQNIRLNTDYGDIILNADGGEYIGNAESPENQIATIGDIGVDTEFIVAGGTTGDQPEFDGAPLFTGSYIRNAGGLVHFRIDVNMDNITDFGTGQYYVDLPFPAKYNYHFRDACLHDNSGTVRQYALSGHVYATQSRVTLWFTATSGQDEAFDHNSPALLTVADNFHIAGTYIMQDLP